MKSKIILFALACTMFAACGSSEQRGAEPADTVGQNPKSDSTGATSGSNGTGTDTTDMARQRATREAGNH
ncbi:MAG: hypothetical protein V4687_04865 [Bacteroidota bacterium]